MVIFFFFLQKLYLVYVEQYIYKQVQGKNKLRERERASVHLSAGRLEDSQLVKYLFLSLFSKDLL